MHEGETKNARCEKYLIPCPSPRQADGQLDEEPGPEKAVPGCQHKVTGVLEDSAVDNAQNLEIRSRTALNAAAGSFFIEDFA